jgi:hypothetical protein
MCHATVIDADGTVVSEHGFPTNVKYLEAFVHGLDRDCAFAIDAVEIEPPHPLPNEIVTVQLTLHNSGPIEFVDVRASLSGGRTRLSPSSRRTGRRRRCSPGSLGRRGSSSSRVS